MVKKYYEYILFFLFFFVVTFFYNFFLLNINYDEIWNYGFSYNISNGMIIYRDFNCLQTPLFFFIGSLFIKMFGNHIYAYDIYIAVIVSIVSILCYNKFGKNALILFFIFIPYLQPSYNSLCFLLTSILMFFDKNDYKYKDFLIGFIIGLIFLTKQSIGVVLFFIMLIFYKCKIKSLIGFCIPCFILFIYLIHYNAFYDFINYCFLGLRDFGSSNFVVSLVYMFIFIALIVVILVRCIQTKFKDINLIFILGFQIISYPIFDGSHIMIGVILYFVYSLQKYGKGINKNFKYYLMMSLAFFVCYCTLPKYNYHLYSNESSFLSKKGIYDGVVGGDFSNFDNFIKKINVYISDLSSGYDNIYIFSNYVMGLSYICKLDLGYKINKFDFILNGNMGYKGVSKYMFELEKICSNESCLFFIDNQIASPFTQSNRNIYNYAKEKYRKIFDIKEENLDFSVYSNK